MRTFVFTAIVLALMPVDFGIGRDQPSHSARSSLSASVPPEWQNWGAETDWELTAIARLLLQGEPNAEKFKNLLVLPLKDANAFIVPEGYLLITEGLLERLRGQDEIAFVIAHELAHLVKGHPRNLETDPTRLARLRTEVEKGLGTSVVGTGLQLLVSAVASYYSREREREADAEAIRLMAKAGFDLDAARRVLERLDTKEGFFSWFRSHPFAAERLDIVNRAILRWRSVAANPPKILPPPDRPVEVYVDLQFQPWPGSEGNLWCEFSEEVGKWFWSSLFEAARQASFPFYPAKRWQRHRARVLTLNVTLNRWQVSPLQVAGDEWLLWEIRMNWQLKGEGGEIFGEEEQRFESVFAKGGNMKSEILELASLFAQRLAKFVVRSYVGRTITHQNMSAAGR